MKTLKEANLKGKKVVLRVDFNVPMEKGKILDDSRIKETLPTIQYILGEGASIIIVSHLGRPEGKIVKSLSLGPVAKRLAKILGRKVDFINDIVGAKVRDRAVKLKSGEIVCLENLRFSSFEELGDEKFAKCLAGLGNIFVQEAFANAHRSHASMVAITKFLPSYAGLLFEKEVTELSKILDKPKKPFVFVAGGKKLETKVELLRSILDKADVVLLGGGLANNFLVAEGYEIGKSFYEEDYVPDAEGIMREAYDSGAEVLIPDDVVVAKSISESGKSQEKDIEQIDSSDIIVDIGSKTVVKYAQPLKFAGTVFWNGPMGIAEYDDFANGTKSIASIIRNSDAVSVIGGGDTITALDKIGLSDGFSYVSTGGGAMMKFLSGEKMPAIEALK